ncbi:SRPBCC family protein [uncultured Chitinophaga sp.]|uniref:SRPBCC family protein n=1 Tax=uncultured Chitinophaga sp. TaxID=339340 RepID=UPI0025FA3437|nr:SRPBCC family protein [uncultured Chitinophaga sp.]
MQALFLTIGAIAVVVLVFFIVSLFLPPKVRVARSLFMKAPAEKIFHEINSLRNWRHWSPWHKQDQDPGMKNVYGATEEGPGATYRWESHRRKTGRGKLIITASKPFRFIAADIYFMGRGLMKGYYRLDPADGGTRVTWSFEAYTGNHPLRKLMGLMMDKWMGRDFEKGLNNLKQITEFKA